MHSLFTHHVIDSVLTDGIYLKEHRMPLILWIILPYSQTLCNGRFLLYSTFPCIFTSVESCLYEYHIVHDFIMALIQSNRWYVTFREALKKEYMISGMSFIWQRACWILWWSDTSRGRMIYHRDNMAPSFMLIQYKWCCMHKCRYFEQGCLEYRAGVYDMRLMWGRWRCNKCVSRKW